MLLESLTIPLQQNSWKDLKVVFLLCPQIIFLNSKIIFNMNIQHLSAEHDTPKIVTHDKPVIDSQSDIIFKTSASWVEQRGDATKIQSSDILIWYWAKTSTRYYL